MTGQKSTDSVFWKSCSGGHLWEEDTETLALPREALERDWKRSLLLPKGALTQFHREAERKETRGIIQRMVGTAWVPTRQMHNALLECARQRDLLCTPLCRALGSGLPEQLEETGLSSVRNGVVSSPPAGGWIT